MLRTVRGREMLGQQLGHRLDASQDRRFVLAFAQELLHASADLCPAFFRHPTAQAAVGHYLDGVFGQQQVNQDPLLASVSQVRNCAKACSAR